MVLAPPATLPEATTHGLLRLARAELSCQLRGRQPPSQDPPQPPEHTREPRGCFVSLHSTGGDLRGCMGNFETAYPLWENVCRMALAAAKRDPRFAPLRFDELEGTHIEISVLSVPLALNPADIRVGTHGLMIRRGPQRGVLLPQVATEQGWDPQTFLEHTCIKAGLPKNVWQQPDTELRGFTAQVFGETKPNG